MMMQMGFQLFDGPDGEMLADFGQAESAEIGDGEHGFEALTAVIPMTEEAAFRWYAMAGVPWAVLSPGWGIAWEGRVEDIAVVDGGIEIGALGGWRALSDTPYTALWSRTTTAGWRPVTVDDITNRSPERYEMDNNNRLYIALRKGEGYGDLANLAELTYAAPHNGSRDIVAFSADYEVLLPTNWKMIIYRCSETFTSFNAITTVTGTGALLTGTINQTFAGQPRIVMDVRNDTGAIYSMTANTGTYYAKLTNIRIKSNTAASITADLIATDMADVISKLNSAQLSGEAALIESSDQDLTDELYEDEWPQDILSALARRADTGGPFEVGVWENRMLHFRPRYSNSRTWLVDAVNLTVSRTMETLRNEMYAVYRDANNRLKRTAVASTVAAGGTIETSRPAPFTRRGFLNAQTTSQTQAESERDARLADTAVITPRAKFDVLGLYDEAGAGPYPLWMARAGDLVIIRNLSPGLGTAVDRLRNFRIKRKRYDVIADVLQLTPELEIPDLAVMVANPGWGTAGGAYGWNTARPVGFTAREG